MKNTTPPPKLGKGKNKRHIHLGKETFAYIQDGRKEESRVYRNGKIWFRIDGWTQPSEVRAEILKKIEAEKPF